jgi:hypothetical protein
MADSGIRMWRPTRTKRILRSAINRRGKSLDLVVALLQY